MKYVGSKARIAKYILPIILKDRTPNQWYVEPFAGGMNSICQVDNPRIATDNNNYLIMMWRELLNGWVPPLITRTEYDSIKQNKNNYPNYLVGWVGFNCSFCGKWFGGFAGQIRTKDGKIRDYQREAISNVLKQIAKLRGVVLYSQSYYNIVLPKDSIIYCDPPYNGTTGYHCGFDQPGFWNWARYKSMCGHKVYISEYNAPSDFECVWSMKTKSSLSANGIIGGSKNSVEKLFRYKG